MKKHYIQLTLFCLFLYCIGSSNLVAQSPSDSPFIKSYEKNKKGSTPADTKEDTKKVSEKSNKLEEKERMRKLSSKEIEVKLTVEHHKKKLPEPIKETPTRGFSKPSKAKFIPVPSPVKISLEDQIKAIVKKIDILHKSDDPNKEAELEKLYKLLGKKKLIQSSK